MGKIKLVFLMYILFFLVLACKSKKNYCESSPEVLLNNKAKYCFTGLTRIDVKEQASKALCVLLSNSSPIKEEVSVNINYGFIEVVSNQSVIFSIIFSDLNGPIIRYNGENYKNDKLVIRAMKFLNMELRDDAAKECFFPSLGYVPN